MSTPPNAPRRSTSSHPSAASSATLHSGHSGHNTEHGDSGSSKRRRVLRAEGGGTAAGEGSADSNMRSQALLGADLAADRDRDYDRDRDRRRRLPRRSGGFLLDSALSAGDAQQQGRHVRPEEKGKLSVDKRRKSKSPGSYDSFNGRYSTVSSARSFAASGETDTRSGGDQTSPVQQGESVDRQQDQRQGPRDLGINVGLANERAGHAPANGGIDPAQIVHMALNLSESRRRNLSAGQLLAPSVSGGRRTTSAGLSINTPMQGSFHSSYGVGPGLKQHLQQQRRISRNLSTSASRATPIPRHVSVSSPSALVDPTLGPQHNYAFSAATLARAAKARTYLELSIEYRRLLQFLPPLKPGAEASNQFLNGPESQLGRIYNPLQFIRNRKLRARERRPLNPDVNDFEDVDRVKAWIDAVEDASGQKNYHQEDRILLPPFDDENRIAEEPEKHPGEPRKPSILLGKAKRPRMDWFTLPSEFLADAVWLEQNSHKSLIEDRNGNKVLPPARSMSAAQPRMSRDQARSSLDKRRLNTMDSNTGRPLSEPRTVDTSEDGSQRGRKKRHFLHNHRDDSPDRGKRLGWISRGRSSSSSGLSSTDDDKSARRKTLDRRLTGQDENIGPLERHMKAMLENETRAEEHPNSPILSSPDKHWGSSAPNTGRRVRSEPETSDFEGRRDRTAAQKATKRLHFLSDKPISEHRPSLEGLDYSAPTTPLTNTFNLGASSPSSRVASPDRKSKRSKLPFFRSEPSVKGRKVETTDFAAENGNGKQPSGELAEPGRLSIDQPVRSNSMKPLPLKSHRTSESLNSLVDTHEHKDAKERKESKEKEPGSAVTRFFKDMGRGSSKVGDFIFKKDKPLEEADEMSTSDEDEACSPIDTDEDVSTSIIRLRPKPESRVTSDTMDSDASQDRRSVKPKYYMDLPAFKSAAWQEQGQESAGEDGGTRGRSTRFDRLAPPRLDLSNVSRSSSPGNIPEIPKDRLAPGRALSEPRELRSRTSSAVRNRINKLLEVPGHVGHAGPPTTSLARIQLSPKHAHSNSRPSPHRHWSISDQGRPRPSAHSVSLAATRTNIARTRALLLCSGVKAAELVRRTHAIRDAPPPFLARAAETAGAHLVAVSRKEEHVLAARILASDLENSSQALFAATEAFRHERVRRLHQRCEEVRITVGDCLTPRCHACADDADEFTREVTSGATLAVKAVMDRVDAMGRARRRRMRWVRRVGWMLLEWTVLGIMWWVWLVVVVVRSVLGVGRGIVKGVRWFLWVD